MRYVREILALALSALFLLSAPFEAADVSAADASSVTFSRNSKTTSDGGSSTFVAGKSTLALYKGESTTLKLTGNTSGQTFSWSSTDKKVATVNSSGKVTAKGYGAASIQAKSGETVLEYPVRVAQKKAIQALRYCEDHYGANYSQDKRMENGYYDCSSFVFRAYLDAGFTLGDSSSWAPTAAGEAQWCENNGYMIYYGDFDDTAKSILLPGDLIFRCDSTEANGRYKGIDHVDIYEGNGVAMSVTWRASSYPEKVLIARPAGARVTGASTKASTSGITVSWSASYGAGKYQVYRSTSKKGTYKKVATVKGTTSYKDTGRTAGKTYYYKVRAYFSSPSKNYNGKFSSVVSAKAKYPVGKPSVKVKKNSKGTVKLKWKKVKNADGYVVYRSTKKGSGYKAVKTIKKGSTVTYTKKNLKKGKTYYYKVKAYKKKSSGKKAYGAASNVKKVKVK